MNKTEKIISAELDEKIKQKLEQIENLPNVEKIIALPDIHIKNKGNRIGKAGFVPSSFGFIAKEAIYPQLVAANINCGMSLIKTGFDYNDHSTEKMEKTLLKFNQGILKGFFLKLRKPLKNKYSLTEHEFRQACFSGSQPIEEKYNLDPSQTKNRESAGYNLNPDNSFFCNLNQDWQKPHPYYKNAIGRFLQGNHFIELQVVDQIFNHNKATEWGIQKNQILIFYHMGQGGLTSFLSQKILNKIIYKEKIQPLKPNHELFTTTLNAVKMLVNYGIACRTMTFIILQDLFKKHLKDKIKFEYFWDHTHDFIQEFNINGQKHYLHSNNANKGLAEKPIIISGTKNMKSFVGYTHNDSQIPSLYDHGYGYSLGKPGTQNQKITDEYNNSQVNLIRAKKEINAWPFIKKTKIDLEKSSAADRVLTDLKNNNSFNSVFSLRPLINYRFKK